MSLPQTVFGLKVGFVLNADEIPIEVLGCIKYLDADGHPQYWVFNSEDLTAVEAAGMSKFIDVQCSDDLETHMYVSLSRGYGGDDDEDDDDLEDA